LEQKFAWFSSLSKAMHKVFDRNTKTGSKTNIMAHYDLSNELYTRFLDETMMYSAAIFDGKPLSLHQASLNKLKHTCERLDIQPGDHILEIGTGWGGMAIYMATHFDCKVTTTTISEAQYQFAKHKIEQLGLAEKITLLRSDYRDLAGQYDKIVSIEMIEAVGHEFLAGYFKQCDHLLKHGGRFVLQSILIDHSRYETYKNDVDFIQKYIFPGGALPSDVKIHSIVNDQTQMSVEAQHDFGLDYAKTLQLWRADFNHNWQEISQFGFDETFRRLWNYYFHYCEGGFNQKAINVAQFVMVKPNR
jgi:cyclopropane-fatty-acyl-phospholipid synthase